MHGEDFIVIPDDFRTKWLVARQGKGPGRPKDHVEALRIIEMENMLKLEITGEMLSCIWGISLFIAKDVAYH